MKAEKWLLKWPFCGKHETQLMFRKAVNTEVTKNKLYKAVKTAKKLWDLLKAFKMAFTQLKMTSIERETFLAKAQASKTQ